MVLIVFENFKKAWDAGINVKRSEVDQRNIMNPDHHRQEQKESDYYIEYDELRKKIIKYTNRFKVEDVLNEAVNKIMDGT